MPASSPVYQPTTVTYDGNSPAERWAGGPVSYLSTTVSRTIRGPCGLQCTPPRNCVSHALLAISFLTVTTGLAMAVTGAVEYARVQQRRSNDAGGDGPQEDAEAQIGDLVIAVVGGIFIVIGSLFIGFYLRTTRWFRACCRTGKEHMSTTSAQPLTMNPSTDLLVTTQYAPVSEVAYQASVPAHEETDTEHSKLMQNDNKDCVSSEENDRMLEADPRIVLRPLTKVEEA